MFSLSGVHSPTLSGSSQLDAFRPLLPPTILIASHQLGGISTTISAYESLILRGYKIDAALIFREEYYRNFEYLKAWFEDRGIPMGVVDEPPAILMDSKADQTSLESYYASISESITNDGGIAPLQSVVEKLQSSHLARLQELDSAPREALDKFWWPFCQHGLVTKESDVMVIDSAHRDFFNVYNPNPNSLVTVPPTSSASSTSTAAIIPTSPATLLQNIYDGSASWWTQCLGHANSELTLAASYASGRYGHILFPSATSAPSLKLAKRLLTTVGKSWASRVFFSDDGSTGMEVGLKMAIRSFADRNLASLKVGESRKLAVLGLKGSYHGDTIGAMDACEGAVFNERVEWYEGRGFWLDCPSVRIENGIPTVRMEGTDQAAERKTEYTSLSSVYDVEHRLLSDPLVQVYTSQISEAISKRYEQGKIQFGVLVLEPVVMGAGGMIFVDPLFQRILIDTVRTDRTLFPDPLPSATHSSLDGTRNWTGLPIIFDEVFVGLRRLGRLQASSFLGATTLPDIACYAKILTGGLVPMAVTLASDSIFQSFWGEKKVDALLHGHSYSAHPVGCEVANRALEIMDKLEISGKFNLAKKDWSLELSSSSISTSEVVVPTEEVWSFWSQSFISQLSHLPNVQGVMSLGTVLAIHLATPPSAGGYQSTVAESLLLELRHGPAISAIEASASPSGLPFNIHARPLGNVVYFMSSLNSDASTLRSVEKRLLDTLTSQSISQSS